MFWFSSLFKQPSFLVSNTSTLVVFANILFFLGVVPSDGVLTQCFSNSSRGYFFVLKTTFWPLKVWLEHFKFTLVNMVFRRKLTEE